MEASVATPGQGAPAAGVQPAADAGQGGAQGQSTATGNGDGQFNWGMFPDVPEAQRGLLEPHLRNVQGHVTRVEQQYAPYKGLTEVVTPDQVENLVGFLNGYSSDPTATVLGMLQQGVQDGSITTEQLQEIMGDQQTPQPGQQAQPDPTQEQVPQWAQQLQQRLEQQEAREAEQAQAQQEAELDQTWEQAKTNIRAQLTQGNIPETLISDQMIVAAVIAHDGDEQAAANMFSSLRDGFLGNFTNGKITPSGQQPRMQGNPPKAPAKAQRRGDGFDAARTGARQMLEQNMAASAQGG